MTFWFFFLSSENIPWSERKGVIFLTFSSVVGLSWGFWKDFFALCQT